jgi:hypothetical protein
MLPERFGISDTPMVLSATGAATDRGRERPFQSRARMGPACAVVDPRVDGATLWSVP